MARAPSFSVSGAGLKTQSFPIQASVFVVPSRTQISGTLAGVTVAAAPGVNLASYRIQVAAPVGQPGTLGPKVIASPSLPVVRLPGLTDGYQLWQGSVDLGPAAATITGLVSIKVLNDKAAVVDLLMVNPGAAGW